MAHRFRQAADAFGRVNWAYELPATALDVLKFVGLFHVASSYGVNFTKCVGPSMEPTVNTRGDLVLIDNFSYRVLQREYQRGDVVICVCPYDAGKTVCKRITATPGDAVTVVRSSSGGSGGSSMATEVVTVIPPGHVWLAGDNVHNSTDSRTYGPVAQGLLRGRVFFKVTSWSRVASQMPPPAAPPPLPPRIPQQQQQQQQTPPPVDASSSPSNDT